MFLAPIEHEAHGGSRLLREMDRHEAKITDAIFGAESSAREIADHAHLVFRELEMFRRLIAHAVEELGGGVDRKAVLSPVGHNAVGFHRGMRLHLGSKLA